MPNVWINHEACETATLYYYDYYYGLEKHFVKNQQKQFKQYFFNVFCYFIQLFLIILQPVTMSKIVKITVS